MSHSVRLKTRNISRLSGYCKFRYRLRSCLGSRFRSIFRNCPVLEMLAVQFSNFEILSISFERTHGKNTRAYLGVFSSRNCLRFFLLDSHGSYCVHLKQLNSMIFFSLLQQFVSQRFGESFCYNNLTRCKSGKWLSILHTQ